MKRTRFPLLLYVVLLAGLFVTATLKATGSFAAVLSAPTNDPASSNQAYPEIDENFDLPLIPKLAGNISGYVFDPNNNPVEGASITVYDLGGFPVASTISGLDGSYTFQGLPAGEYTLVAFPPGGPWLPSDQAFVRVLDGQTVFQDLYLRQVLISGWVMDVFGGSIPGAWVVAHNDDWSVEVWELTDVEGMFLFSSGLTIGVTYTLEAFAPEGTPYVPVGPVQVVPPATDVILFMEIPPLNVTGTVIDPAGYVISNSLVYVTGDSKYFQTLSDYMGRFDFSDLPVGDYRLQAVPPWGSQGLLASEPISISIVDPQTLIDVGLITLPYATKTVYGQVVEAGTTHGISETLVWANRLDASGSNFTVSDVEGAFSMSLSRGAWHLGLEPKGWPTDWFFVDDPVFVKFSLPNSIPETKTITLEVVTATAWVTGRIVCPGGALCNNEPPPTALWVKIWNDLIENGSSLNNGYTFTLPVVEGWYQLDVYTDDYWGLQAPSTLPFHVSTGEILDLGDIELLAKDALIQGRVTDQRGRPVPGVPILAWQPEGSFWGLARTNVWGMYYLPVVGGAWFVTPEPAPQQPYVYLQQPVAVYAAPGEITGGIDFKLIRANALIHGFATDAETGESLPWLDGWAWSEAILGAGGTILFSDAPMKNGNFWLKALGNHEYNIGVDLHPESDYLSGSTGPLMVNPGEVTTAEVPLEAKDAWIEGFFMDGITGEPVAGNFEVYGLDREGNWTSSGFEPGSDWYSLGVISGTWALGADLDPESGYVVPPIAAIVPIRSGEVVSQDLMLWPIDSTLSGQVLDPDGAPLRGAYVVARGISTYVGYYETFTRSDANGFFELRVPKGMYAVGAGLPGAVLRARGWLNPPVIEGLWATPDDPVESLVLSFRLTDGLIHGNITFASGMNITLTQEVYVWAWAESGEWTEAQVPFQGTTATYSLPVVSDAIWHLGAVYEDWASRTYYESLEAIVPVPLDGSVSQDLVLEDSLPLFAPLIISFDATQMQTIELPNGAVLRIPAGALARSGHVTLYLFPTRQLHRNVGQEVIGLGYEIRATNQFGREITRFNRNIVVTLPYPSDDELATLGIMEADIIPAYYSTLLGRWVIVSNFVRDSVNNKLTFQVDHFSKFGTGTNTLQIPGNRVYLPVLAK